MNDLPAAAGGEPAAVFVGGIAHDFNNIVTVIAGTAQLIELRSAPGDPAGRLARHIIEATSRASVLVADLLSFNRARAAEPAQADLNTVVGNAGRFVEHLVGERIALDLALTDGELPVSVDAYQIEQVLLNLAANARDAMPYGGRITITTGCPDGGDAADGEAPAGPGRYAVLTFADNGAGMDAETRERIFEPFFTTKKDGRGTGLGLAMVRSVVERHGGTVAVSSDFGEGTCVVLRLPLRQD
ncbi:hypothetical protein FO488_18675 [Geobacter sp. FeAm09]|uniref:sensor histidine kinase n=1 Tax=Geobacter sp. FeAm09 TaxID=2597769 RepID=UPI0011F06E5C|nr:ATP-binding protein [Geobacter sp. FeAm09]QEM69984.1 hypothetical protein FO488_18675 [Geobacter sp. FeAm09]